MQRFDLFHEIDQSCSAELLKLGIKGTARVVPGGVEVKFSEINSDSLRLLKDIPVKGLDFTSVEMPDIDTFSHFPITSLAVPPGSHFNLAELKIFELEHFSGRGSLFKDFSPLKNHALSSLDLAKTSVTDLSFCSGGKLKSLNLEQCKINDLSPLENHQNLRELNIFKCEVSDLTALQDSQLQTLTISGNPVLELDSLRNCPLRNLGMRATKVCTLEPLADCPLEILHLPGSPIDFIGGIINCPIRELNIIGLSLKDFDRIHSLPLESLSLSPEKLSPSEFDKLKDLGVNFLIGPGDDIHQSKESFFLKYSSPTS